MVRDHEPKGWLPLLFFGLIAVVFAAKLLPNSTYLKITDDGLTLCTLFRVSKIPWDQVETFYPGRIRANKMVFIRRPAEQVEGKIGIAISAALTDGAHGALPETYGMSAEALSDLLNAELARARSKSNPSNR